MQDLGHFFKELKIVELASVLAGPLCGSFFAELGAEVVKVENKLSGGDITRQWKIEEEPASDETSSYYHSANYGKTPVLLDLNEVKDMDRLVQLIANADVITSNFQQKVAHKFKLEYEDVKAIKHDIIMVQLNAYDYDDPRPGFDLVMQAETGFISMCGDSSESLAKMPVAMLDIIAGHQMKEAVLLALIHKMRTGQGSCIHVSLYQSGVSALVNQGTNFLNTGHIARPMGTMHPNIAPYGDVYQTSDNEQFMLAIGSDEQFKKLVETLNAGNELVDYLCDNQSRLRHRSQLNRYLQEKIVQFTAEDLFTKLAEVNLPFCKINDISQVFHTDLAKEMILESHVGELAHVRYSISNVAFKACH